MKQQPIKQKPNTNNFIYQPARLRTGPMLSDNAQSPQVQHYRNIGNQAVQRMLEYRALQAKLKIGKPNDKYEQEADSVADRVTRMPEPTCPECINKEKEGEIKTKPLAEQITPLVQRQPDEEEEELKTNPLLQRQVEEEKEEDEEINPKLMDNQQLQRQELPEEEEEKEPVQTKLMGTDQLQRQEDDPDEDKEETPVLTKAAPGSTPEVSPGVESSINTMKGGGQPLSESTRTFFEPRFGADFSGVRVHTDSLAVETAQAINAKAFTTGKDIVFNSGQYSPNTTAGKHLLAHELTHVVQQGFNPMIYHNGFERPYGSFNSNVLEYSYIRHGKFSVDNRYRRGSFMSSGVKVLQAASKSGREKKYIPTAYGKNKLSYHSKAKFVEGGYKFRGTKRTPDDYFIEKGKPPPSRIFDPNFKKGLKSLWQIGYPTPTKKGIIKKLIEFLIEFLPKIWSTSKAMRTPSVEEVDIVLSELNKALIDISEEIKKKLKEISNIKKNLKKARSERKRAFEIWIKLVRYGNCSRFTKRGSKSHRIYYSEFLKMGQLERVKYLKRSCDIDKFEMHEEILEHSYKFRDQEIMKLHSDSEVIKKYREFLIKERAKLNIKKS